MERWNETRTEKLIQAAMKKHAGVPKNRCYVHYDKGEWACAYIVCFYPLLSLQMAKVRAAIYYISILLRPETGNAARLWVQRQPTGWDLIAEVYPSR